MAIKIAYMHIYIYSHTSTRTHIQKQPFSYDCNTLLLSQKLDGKLISPKSKYTMELMTLSAFVVFILLSSVTDI